MATRPPGLQADGQMTQQGVERGEFVVHRDAEGLENAARW